jgi:uncharacterized protein YkwD
MLALQANPPAAPPREAAPFVERSALLAGINAARETAGVPSLSPSPDLDGLAQARAAELAEHGGLPTEADSDSLFRHVGQLLARARYAAHVWTESATASAGPVDTVIGYWREDSSFAEAMRSTYRDVGIGMARLRGVPLYIIFLASPERDFYERQVVGLKDLVSVRRAMLDAVNVLRRTAGAPPLVEDARLDRAAQSQADAMLAGTPYGHIGVAGSTPRDRIEKAGLGADLVAENIAARHPTIEAALSGWMASSQHRHNLLDPRLTLIGLGVAVGNWEHPYQTLWVQDFARPGLAP